MMNGVMFERRHRRSCIREAEPEFTTRREETKGRLRAERVREHSVRAPSVPTFAPGPSGRSLAPHIVPVAAPRHRVPDREHMCLVQLQRWSAA